MGLNDPWLGPLGWAVFQALPRILDWIVGDATLQAMDDEKKPPKSLNELLDRIDEVAEENDEVSMEELMKAVGRRSFGPLLLLVGVIAVAPGVGDIPGVATLLGIFVLTVSVQLLFGRTDFWLPQWILKRKARREKLRKMAASQWLRKPANWIDKAVTERLEVFTGPRATYAIAVATTVMALVLPMTEFIPLSTNLMSLGLVAYGISLIANDGLMALVGYGISAATLVLLVMGGG